jgi:hypothetical protein
MAALYIHIYIYIYTHRNTHSGVSQTVCGVETAGFLKKLAYPKTYNTHTEYTKAKHNQINGSGLKWSFLWLFNLLSQFQ